MQPRRFGETPAGETVELYTLSEPGGVELSVMTYGAAVQRLLTPSRGGKRVNVVLGFATLDGYLADGGHYFGAIIGRVANRVAEGRFTLDGRVHELSRNAGAHSLHGGPHGFDKRVWDVVDADAAHVALRLTSPDGEMGYPGTLTVQVTYRLVGGALQIDYAAVTDAPTTVNLTNHTCWNLAGEGSGSVDEHVLTVNASAYTPVGPGLIPTGEIAPIAETPFDFRTPTPIGERLREAHPQLQLARGYDHNLVLDRGDSEVLALAARVEEPQSGRVLEIRTTEPGIQVYTGNFFDGTLVGPSGRAYRQGDGVAFETQHFPDAPNHRDFPSTVVRPGTVYRSTTLFRIGKPS